MEEVPKRIFIGIKIDNLKREILSIQKKYSLMPVRWIPIQNLHITLIPPWYEKELSKIRKLLKKGFWNNAFEVEFTKIRFGPEKKYPRLIWVEGKISNELVNLKKGLEELLGKKSQKKFKPHITLARFKQRDFREFPIQVLNEKIFWKQKVNYFVVFESLSDKYKRVFYKILQRIDLKE